MTADRYQLKDALVSGVSQMESDEQCKSRYDGLGEEFRGMCMFMRFNESAFAYLTYHIEPT